jgi:uncharacterized protein
VTVDLWLAFSIGILGSLHCVGMCGPIAMMIPGSGAAFWRHTFVYHAGRILAYLLLGSVIGLLGQGIAFAGWQSWFSIALGVTILAVVLLSLPLERSVVRLPLLSKYYSFVREGLARQLRKDPVKAGFGIGFFNGLIPCGLVYLAIAGAIAAGSWWRGGIFMVLFGLGTVPALAATAYFAGSLKGRLRPIARRVVPMLLVVIALVFIYRGLNTAFPVDLRFWELKDNPEMCH